jgi:uncharacterized protein
MTESLSLTSLPLFPLGTVLYPGGSLSLRIFEVRYLDMIRKCHKSGAPFGVVSLTEGSEVRRPGDVPSGDGFAQESFNPVGTLARLVDVATPQAGLMMIRCVGTQRFKISRHEKLKHGLWTADVSQLPDDQTIPVPDDLKKSATALGNLITKLRGRDLPASEMPMHEPYLLDDCAWVANRWCELLSMPLELKQRLMELDNPLVRLELVGDMLERNGIVS